MSIDVTGIFGLGSAMPLFPAKQNQSPNLARWAHGKVANALRTGSLVRPSNCERCGRHIKVDAHHADYAKPLDVQWLCRSCHLEIDGRKSAKPEKRKPRSSLRRLPPLGANLVLLKGNRRMRSPWLSSVQVITYPPPAIPSPSSNSPAAP